MMFTDRERRLLACLMFFLASGYLIAGLRAVGIMPPAGTIYRSASTNTADSCALPAGAQQVTAMMPSPFSEREDGISHFHDSYLDLNLADSLDLIRLPGIGPTLAGRILKFRLENNGFVDLKSLLAVKGIGGKRLESLQGYLVVRSPFQETGQ